MKSDHCSKTNTLHHYLSTHYPHEVVDGRSGLRKLIEIEREAENDVILQLSLRASFSPGTFQRYRLIVDNWRRETGLPPITWKRLKQLQGEAPNV